jgi:AAA+ ATPase superfamily predicted ATPase
MSLIGREEELAVLKKLITKKTASMVCVRGRRRIGKSALIKTFSKNFDNVIEIQGLAPALGNSNKLQLAHFSKELSRKFKIPLANFIDWTDALNTLATFVQKSRYLIFLDEISWMGKYDPNFAGKLKVCWDTQLKNNDKLILILCGSVSTWIQKNILNNTGFVGRISLNLKIRELSLASSIKLMGTNKLNDLEQIKLLSITGGVPKYLEEINSKETAEQNIERLILNSNGILFNEFEQIFNDIFEKRAVIYKKIILEIINGTKHPKEIAKKIKVAYNGEFSEYLEDLCESGFLQKHSTWSTRTGKESNLSHYRIADNFLHYYLKNVYPIRNRIEKFPLKISALKNWESIIGYQFQNIILNNYLAILEQLRITAEEVTQIGPYFQNQSTKHAGCQIDLLIQTKFNNLFLCEIKCKSKIEKSVINEIRQKIKNLDYGKNFTVRPVIICCGEVSTDVLSSDFFFKIVQFSDLR